MRSRAIRPLIALVAGTLLAAVIPTFLATATRAQNDVEGQVASGASLYAEWCSMCHGVSGEGAEGPPVAAPRSIATFRTAGRLFEFLSTSMPADFPGLLTDAEYYDLVALLLDWNGLNGDGLAVDAETAPGIMLSN
jgi:mono/diheme cytochrome c family protein